MKTFPTPALALLVTAQLAACSKTSPPPTAPPAEAPAEVPASGTTSAPVVDPCDLFTREDFAAVFDKPAADPDRDNDATWAVCTYAFADLARGNTAYGLDIKVLKASFTREGFEASYEALAGRMKAIGGIGDVAYLLPAADADSATGLFVLAGRTSIVLSLYEPPPAAQGQARIQAAARRIVKRLASSKS